MNKWKKVIIGMVLISGFVIYTQYQKNAEPVWKVNGEEFTVVNNFQDGMKREYTKYEELKVVDHYGLLKNVNRLIQLKEQYRTLRIEKIWNSEGRLYFLYSVDLKERDKDERDVPRITVKKVKLSTSDGKESEFSASENSGIPGSRDEGFVYKHRLYRSMMVVPMIVNHDQMNWELLTQADRIELSELEISYKNGIDPLENIAFKVSSENIYLKVLESLPINKKFTYGNNKNAELKTYDVLLYDRRLSLSLPKDDNDLVGFSGNMNGQSNPYLWDVVGSKDTGYYLPFYGDPLVNPSNEKSITLKSSFHKSDQIYKWTIPKEDIMNFNMKDDQPLVRNEEIVNQNNIKIIYEGLERFNGGPKVKIGVIHAIKYDINPISLIPESYYGIGNIPEEYARSYRKNLVTITNDKNEKLRNFDMFNEESESKATYYINFYKEDINDGAINPIPIPEENLTLTLSDLVYSKPLPAPLTIKFNEPDLKK